MNNGRRSIRAWTMLLVALLAGCSGYMVTRSGSIVPVPNDPQVIADFDQCWESTQTLGLIPDLGITLDQHLFKCMQQAGWDQQPRWNAKALNRYRRIEQK